MEKRFFRRHHTPQAHAGGVVAWGQFLNGLLKRLADFVQVTEEEQNDAGIYLGDQHDR
jgi:hypothetical protein